MRKLASIFMVFVLALGLVVTAPIIFAGEHGGSEHGGDAMEDAGADAGAASHAATLLEAATALQDSNPDLAAKLREMANEMS